MAASHDQAGAARTLLANGSEVSDIDNQRCSALMFATQNGSANVLDELIEKKAGVHLKN